MTVRVNKKMMWRFGATSITVFALIRPSMFGNQPCLLIIWRDEFQSFREDQISITFNNTPFLMIILICLLLYYK